MANLTPQEQYMLELINRARLDPKGEAARYGISLNEGVSSSDKASSKSKQALAGNDALGFAADKHSDWMILNDGFSHSEKSGTPGFYGADPFIRMNNAGYSFTTAGENIGWMGTTGTLNLTSSVGDIHKNLFVDAGVSGRGHRVNILKEDYREIGIGHASGDFKGYNASMITQDFGASGNTRFITGVVYDDKNGNNFFTVGEETAGRGVAGPGVNDITGAGGGYELGFTSAGSRTVTFDLATGPVTVTVSLGDRNAKVDIVNGNEVWTDTTLVSNSTAIRELHALGNRKLNLTGSDAKEKIYGNDGKNTLIGNGAKDKIYGEDGNDYIVGGAGKDVLTGGGGKDKFVYLLASDSTATKFDKIKDFGDSGKDKIDLSAIFAGTLTYRDEAKINGANQVSVSRSGSDVIVHINLDADLGDDMRIVLDNTSLSSMTKGDFIL